MAAAVERIVVPMTSEDKMAIAAKAKEPDLAISELIRRGAFAYGSGKADAELGALADSARSAADRAGAAIDDALSFIEAGNRCIAAMEAAALRAQARKAAGWASPTRSGAR